LVAVHLCVEVAADDAGEFQKNWIDELEPPWFGKGRVIDRRDRSAPFCRTNPIGK
jgi:hypothetical protein